MERKFFSKKKSLPVFIFNLRGAIDARTTKRLVQDLEREANLKTFEVRLKSVLHMCVRAADVDENDEIFKNYCGTFRRTYESIDLNVKNKAAAAAAATTTTTTAKSESEKSSDDEMETDEAGTSISAFKLTSEFTKSIVEKLQPLNKKYFGVSKFQKAIILHRFIHYLLFFYDGKQQSVNSALFINTIANYIFTFFSIINFVAKCSVLLKFLKI